MLKYLVLLFNLLGLLIFNFFSNDVSVSMVVPKEVQAGTDFVVELTVNKGKTTGLGRFQQTLPEGCSAVADNNSQLMNADFKFQYQTLRLMWLILPAEETYTVKYTIHVDPSVTNKIKLGGQFVYLKDNQRVPVEVPEQEISVTPGTGATASNVQKTDSTATASSNTGSISILPPDRNVKCIREKLEKNETGDAMIVKLNVTKDIGNNYAKIQDDLPAGYKAEVIESKGAIFTFKDKTAKFLWMNLPADGSFQVSYKIMPEDKYVSLDKLSLKGSFSFMENDKNYSVNIIEPGQSVPENNTNLAQNTANTNNTVKNNSSEQNKNPNSDQNKNNAKGADVKNQQVQNDKKNNQLANNNRKKDETEKKNTVKNNSVTSVPSPQKGVFYKVQLAAGHSPIHVPSYFRNLKVNDKVETEMHDGWRKYTVGAFPNYSAARDHRVFIWDSTTIDDAFVSAYNDGNRITVQEALMIANQKWIK